MRPPDVSFALYPVPGRSGMLSVQEDQTLTIQNEAADPRAAQNAAPDRAGPVSVDALLAEILSSLNDDKSEDVVSIDLRGKSEIADHMVVCSGRSTRQVSAMAEKLIDRLKSRFGVRCRVEGKDQGDWVLIDADDVIVHIFRPEVREFYQLEKLWSAPHQAAAKA